MALPFIAIVGCHDGNRSERALNALEQELAALEIEHSEMDKRIDSLWDDTSLRLAKAIPAEFPPLDRELFIEARNADHIRMFMSFDLLDSATQELVHAAGYQDQSLAESMRALIERKQALSEQRYALLVQMHGTADAADAQGSSGRRVHAGTQ